MSSFKEFALEKEKIDFYQDKGYKISKVTESLDGAYVEYELQENQEDKHSIVLNTADGRKYLSSIVFEQQKERFSKQD
ncbi:hypothetical protein [Paenisporosarcina sp. TG20]|uniref:hypothetical protein n=1 Tax=Paenisporosarcina sp. TG20 TaxID=1211706 RepID=UPI00031C1992|nr:hypothetical protein [Paenisporosarcina sp. TG20]